MGAINTSPFINQIMLRYKISIKLQEYFHIHLLYSHLESLLPDQVSLLEIIQSVYYDEYI